ncbi:MAG: basic rane protein [Gaiellaceae bacterium]|nr:basic rane protein [Gaiellaceae bacterium]MDX6473885.1 basic rane protein [Gaiellaceae bacterium]
MKKVRFVAPLAALAAVAVVVAALAGTGAAAPSKQHAGYSAGLVSDVGRFNDKGFNQNQLTGLKFAKSHIPALTTYAVESRSSGEYLPNFASLARRGVNIIIGAGFLLANQEATVAKQFPNTKFAITDYDVTGAPFNGKKSPNVEGLTYATQENSYLVGCIAGSMAKIKKSTTVGVVGGVKIPPVDTFLAGYQAGVAKCAPGVKVLVGYSQDFVDQAKCETVAQNQIDQGAAVVFAVAGPCGLGALDAAKQAGVYGIGVDVDQSYLGPYILTSAVKRVDNGVYLAIKGAQAGQFKGGANLTFNLKNSGVGLGKVSSVVPASVLKKVAQLRAQIVAGKIVPPTKVK